MSTVLLSPRRFATEAFDTDLDSLEEGKARELIASEFMSAAAASSEWTCCTLRRPRKCEFRLEDAQGRFMLGAVKDSDGELSVSGYDAPPASASRRRRGAVLRRTPGRHRDQEPGDAAHPPSHVECKSFILVSRGDEFLVRFRATQ